MDHPSSKLERLRSSGEFRRVREEGVSFSGKWLVMGVWRDSSAVQAVPSVRFGVVTSRKVGGAVVRNRVRRRIRHIQRAHRCEFQGNVWCVTVARFRAAQASFAELEMEWCKLAKRAGVLRS